MLIFINKISIVIKDNHSICQLNEDKVLFEGYRDDVPFLFVLNVSTKKIETLLKGICQGSIYLFTSENKIQLFTKDGRLININKNTLTISKRYIVKKEFINILSITTIKKGEFIAICSNNELITFSDK